MTKDEIYQKVAGTLVEALNVDEDEIKKEALRAALAAPAPCDLSRCTGERDPD